MRKFLSFLLTLALSLSITAPAVIAEESPKSDDIVILYTNDITLISTATLATT